MAYSALALDHFARPRHAGRWPDDAAGIAAGEARTPASAAVMRFQVRVVGDRIAAARFQAYGCVATIAAGSWLAERVTGVAVDEALGLKAAAIADALALPAEKRHCALIVEDALRSALASFTRTGIRADNTLIMDTSR